MPPPSQLRLPSLNGLVGDTLAASPYRFDRKLVQRRKDLGRDPFRNARQVAQALRGKRGGPPQGQAAQNRGHERLKLLVSFPAWQRNLGNTARKLRVTRDRLACVGDAQAHEGSFQFVAEEPEQLEHDTLLARAAGQQIVHLVEDEHAYVNLLQQPHRPGLKIGERR